MLPPITNPPNILCTRMLLPKFTKTAENRVRFLIPYGDAELDAVLYIEEQERSRFYLFPNVTVGILQIYEMIPSTAS